MSNSGPVEVAEGVWWVGTRLDNDSFQCHAYLIDNGDRSVLLDPGSPLTIEATLDKVARVTSLDSIKYLVCHHPDPDIAASLPYLSSRLTRDDVEVVTEWRAKALLRHYGHRFAYYLADEMDWTLPLSPGRHLEFQLTPYLHFPGAMVSFDTRTRTLFTSDLFGGFVPDSDVLVSHDLDYIIESARPFHQHYMPSSELLTSALSRVEERWPDAALIAPQHGHVIPGDLVHDAFTALKGIECGVFTLADADLDLQRLLRISDARTQITRTLLTVAEPASLVAAMNAILASTNEARECALFIDVPGTGWAMWGLGHTTPLNRVPNPSWPVIELAGSPAAVLAIHTPDNDHPDESLMRMLGEMAPVMRPAVDQFLEQRRTEMRAERLRDAALTDPLTGLGNRRALEATLPVGAYALLSLDLDNFKGVNDAFGHEAGDEVLTRAADVIRGSIREGDASYRLGGEEFLVCLPGADSPLAVVIAERIRTTLSGLDLTGLAPGGQITVSIGVASAANAEGSDFARVLRSADEALYESKAEGRDRITVRMQAGRADVTTP